MVIFMIPKCTNRKTAEIAHQIKSQLFGAPEFRVGFLGGNGCVMASLHC